MAAAKTVEILMRVRSDLQELQRTNQEMRALQERTASFSADLRQGFAIDVMGRLNEGLASIPARFKQAISTGVQFNAALETSQLGIAAVLKQFDRKKEFTNFQGALNASARAIELLRAKAMESPATFQQLVGAFQGLSGAYASANIPLQKQVDLTVLMSQTLAGLGIQSEQILQESRALLTGNITQDAMAAKILGITNEMVNSAKAEGRLAEFLEEKMSSFAEAGALSGDTFATASSNLQDAYESLTATLTRPLQVEMTRGIKDLTAALAKPETQAMMGRLAQDLRQVAQGAIATAQGLAQLRPGLEVLLKLGTALAVLKTAQMAGGWAAGAGRATATAAVTPAMMGAGVAPRTFQPGALEPTTGSTVARSGTIFAMAPLATRAAEARQAIQAQEAALKASSTAMARYTTLAVAGFGKVTLAARTLGTAIYTALGPMGVAFIAAEGMRAVLGAMTADLEKWNDAIVASVDREASEVKAAQQQLNEISSLGERAKFIEQQAAAEKRIWEERDKAVKALRDSLPYETDKKKLLQGQIDRLDQDLALRGSIITKSREITVEEMNRRAVMKQQNDELRKQLALMGNVKERADQAVLGLRSTISGLKDEQRERWIESLPPERQLEERQAESQTTTEQMLQTGEHRFGVDPSLFNPEEPTKYLEAVNAAMLAQRQKMVIETPSGQKLDLLNEVDSLKQREAKANEAREKDPNAPAFNYEAEVSALEQRFGEGALLRAEFFVDDVNLMSSQVKGVAESQSVVREEEKEFGETTAKREELETEKAITAAKAEGRFEDVKKLELEERIQQIKDEHLAAQLPITDAEARDLALMQQKAQVTEAAHNEATQAAEQQAEALANQDAAYEAILKKQQNLDNLRQMKSLVEDDPNLSPEAKQRALLPILAQEQAAITELLPLLREYIALKSGDPEAQQNVQAAIGTLTSETKNSMVVKKQVQTSGPAMGLGGLQAGWDNWLTELGTNAEATAQLVQGSLGSAVDGLSQGINGLVMGTMTWKDAMRQTVGSIIQQLIQTGVQMALINTLGTLFNTQKTAEAVTSAGTISTAMAPAAAMNAAATSGVGPTLGIAAMLAAVAAAMTTMGGFRKGGYTGSGPSTEPAGIVHRGEYVIPAGATSRVGTAYLDALVSGISVPRLPGYRAGGLVGAGGRIAPTDVAAQGDTKVHVGGAKVNVFTPKNDRELRRAMRSSEGDNIIVDAVRRHWGDLGGKA